MRIKCNKCGEIAEFIPVSRLVTTEIDGKKFNIQTNGYVCPKCDHFFFNENEVINMALFIKQKIMA